MPNPFIQVFRILTDPKVPATLVDEFSAPPKTFRVVKSTDGATPKFKSGE
jgi:hypothetical protein